MITRCGLNTDKPTFVCKEVRPGESSIACGRCRVAACVSSRHIANCSECSDFPCEMLMEFSYCPDTGDAGARIQALTELRNSPPTGSGHGKWGWS